MATALDNAELYRCNNMLHTPAPLHASDNKTDIDAL
jgi:hypothetical protein